MILRYLYISIDVCFHLESINDRVIGYVDFDYVGQLDKEDLLLDIFVIGGCAFSWKVIMQSTVALSTTEVEYTEVEYMIIKEGCKEAIW